MTIQWLMTILLVGIGAGCAQSLPMGGSSPALATSADVGPLPKRVELPAGSATRTAASPLSPPAVARQLPSADEAIVASQDDSLPRRLRRGLRLNHLHHPRITALEGSLKQRTVHLQSLAERGRIFLPYLMEVVAARGLPLELAMVPLVESSLDPKALSSRDAAGLWQLLPATASYLLLERNEWYDGRYDIPAATRAALDYLEYLLVRFGGDWLLALAAYNVGEGVVGAALAERQITALELHRRWRQQEPSPFWVLPLPEVTQHYVLQIVVLARIYAQVEEGELAAALRDEVALRAVAAPAGADLAALAQAAGLSVDELYYFNPCLSRDAKPPRSVELLLPAEAAERLVAARRVEPIPPPRQEPSLVTRANRRLVIYRVQPDESLMGIARRFGVRLTALRRWNRLPEWIMHVAPETELWLFATHAAADQPALRD